MKNTSLTKAKNSALTIYITESVTIGPDDILGDESEVERVLRNLANYSMRSRGSYAANTDKANRNNLRYFKQWCDKHNHAILPTSPNLLTKFIDSVTPIAAQSSINGYVTTIRKINRESGFPDPYLENSSVTLALKRMRRKKAEQGEYTKQAKPMLKDNLDDIIADQDDSLVGTRNKALLSVAYRTGLRVSEVVRIKVEHVDFFEQTLLIPYTKVNISGEPEIAFLDKKTLNFIRDWQLKADIESGFLFRAILKKTLYDQMSTKSVWRLYRKYGFSTHSTRVGGCQDMLASNLSTSAIMQSFRWKSTAMISRYAKNTQAVRSGSAQLAQIQGDD